MEKITGRNRTKYIFRTETVMHVIVNDCGKHRGIVLAHTIIIDLCFLYIV